MTSSKIELRKLTQEHMSWKRRQRGVELYDEDYEVYIEKDFDATIFEFPIYYIFIKDKNNEIDLNGNSITIEII